MAHTLTFTTTDTGRVYETLSPLITGLQGPLPDLRLPALQELQLNTNQYSRVGLSRSGLARRCRSSG